MNEKDFLSVAMSLSHTTTDRRMNEKDLSVAMSRSPSTYGKLATMPGGCAANWYGRFPPKQQRAGDGAASPSPVDPKKANPSQAWANGIKGFRELTCPSQLLATRTPV